MIRSAARARSWLGLVAGVLGAAFVIMVLAGLWAAPSANAIAPPGPVVTTPAGPDVSVVEAAQPVHFEGTVPGPVTDFDRVFVVNNDGSGDPPQICNIVLMSTDTAWACDANTTFPIGDYVIEVSWSAQDPSFDAPPEKTTIALHVVAEPAPTPTPTPTPPPPTSAPTPPPAQAVPTPRPDSATPTPTAAPTPTPTSPAAEPTPVAEPPVASEPPATTPPAASPATAPVLDDPGLRPWVATDHPKVVLGIGATAFTVLTLVGPAGLALSGASTSVTAGLIAAGGGAAGAAGSRKDRKGSVKAAKVKSHKFSGADSGAGDQSRTWQLPGWRTGDALSTAVPVWLATRSPLTARVLADGAYLRAVIGTAWVLGCLGTFGLGLAAARQTDGLPIPPSVGLTAVLLALAIVDATWGAAGVAGFVVAMAFAPSSELGFLDQARSFLGLAALWFAIPLIAAASRPFRRSVAGGTSYAWDRFGDTVIAALIAGWAVQKTVGGLPGLSGLDLPIADHADQLALVAMTTIVARVLVEELAARRYPLRLAAVSTGKLPFSGPAQRLFATALRTALFTFLAIAFIGACWQLWVGAVLFAVPQVLSVYERSFPNSERLNRLLPAGVLKVLVMLLVGTLFGRLVFAVLDDPESMLRNGFLLLSLPGLALSLVGLFGHDGPDPTWAWGRQLLGAVVVVTTVGLVLTGW